MEAMTCRAATLGLAGLLSITTASAADLLSGQWRGSYTCYQGSTALVLAIEPDGQQWSGMFAFGPPKDNKSVPHGAYQISITESDGVYSVVPGDWIEQPDGYTVVGVRGAISEDLTTFSGEIDFDGCTTFEAVRTSPLPDLPVGKTK